VLYLAMAKGIETKTTILEIALNEVRKLGFEALTIGELAKLAGMSKSGLFSHFKSKEQLQVTVIDYAAENFTLQVIRPALKLKRGLPRLEGLMANWIKWSSHNKEGGCPLISAAVEFDDRPGVVQDTTKKHLKNLIESIKKSISLCVEEGHFKSSTDCEQVTYELYSQILGFHLYQRLLKNKNSKQMFEQSIKDLFNRQKV
jgi:AcrR family transcriptional regulator